MENREHCLDEGRGVALDGESRKAVGDDEGELLRVGLDGGSVTGQKRAAGLMERSAEIGALQIGCAIRGGGMQTENFLGTDLFQRGSERRGFKAAVDGVTGLGVAALKVEQVAGFQTHTGASQAHAGWSESAQACGERWSEISIVLVHVAHAVSSLSG
jgi:hypothetical protein